MKGKHVSLGIATPPPQASVPWCGLGEALFSTDLLLPSIYSPALSVLRRLIHGLVIQTPCPLAWANAEGPDERLGGLLPASLLAELESELQPDECWLTTIRELLPCSGWPYPATRRLRLPPSLPGSLPAHNNLRLFAG